MALLSGSCRLGLWFVHVFYDGSMVHRVRFSRTGIEGDVPDQIRLYCAGRSADLSAFGAPSLAGEGTYPRVYRVVREIPYGRTATYGEIAERAGTHPRVVGQAMARNPVPLIVPCHRVVASDGIGGFTPPVEIKELLLAMEKKRRHKLLNAPDKT